jgi:hypothetical protein
MIEFSDGSTADASGELRIEEGPGGWYVLGTGLMFPAADREEAEVILGIIVEQGLYFAMKMQKSEGFRAKVLAMLAARSGTP